jgi:hypothetical protein
MLAWRTQSGGVPTVPACLSGWEPRGDAQLVHRETDKGHVVYVGEPLVWNQPRTWQEAEEGWEVAVIPGVPFDPRLLARVQGWAGVAEIQDMHRRTWLCPLIREPGGRRAFQVAYGRNWLPALTPEQSRAEEICRAALDATNQDTPMSVICQWAAELLSLTHHTTPAALAAAAVVDGILALETLRVAASIQVEAVHNGI